MKGSSSSIPDRRPRRPISNLVLMTGRDHEKKTLAHMRTRHQGRLAWTASLECITRCPVLVAARLIEIRGGLVGRLKRAQWESENELDNILY